jgi:LysW-gamma-L-lysine carboxypeptidase
VQDYAVDLLTRMVKVYSPTGEEEQLADLLFKEMEKHGFHVERDGVGNVLGRQGRDRPHVLLCGHMDTVPGFIPVRIEDGLLYGRGAVDAKGPLAAMIIASSQLAEEGFDGSLTVVGVVDEEGKGLGAKHLAGTGIDIDYAIFGEPTNVDTITIGYKGSLLLKIVCETETGHSSAPWLFENAVEKAIEIWNLITDYARQHERPGSHFNSLSTCLRRIKGGEVHSVVPPRCEIHIGMRIPPALTVEQLQSDIFSLIDTYKAENPNVQITTEIEDFSEPYVVDKRAPHVRALSYAIWKTRGKPAKLMSKTGTGDMNVFGNYTDKPSVSYGPGDSHLDHTSNEHIKLGDYLESIKVLKMALKKLHELCQ